MSSIGDIRDALVTTLTAAVPSLAKVYRSVGSSVNVLPALVVTPAAPADFDVAMSRGTDTWLFDLIVLVSAADLDVATDILDGYIFGGGPDSIRQAIWNARTLGLSDVDAHVSELTAYNIRYSVCDLDHMAATLRLVVHTRGTQ